MCEVPGGAHPVATRTATTSATTRFCKAWDAISRDRDTFLAWMERHVLGTQAHFVGVPPERCRCVSAMADYTPTEMMTIAAARRLANGTVCFVGIGMPSAAANLARLTHAPDVVLIYESGTIGAKPDVLPLSIGDGELAEYADAVVSVPEIFRYWLQGGRVDVGFLGAAQIDASATSTPPSSATTTSRRCACPARAARRRSPPAPAEVWIILKQSKRGFVDKLDFITSAGISTGGDSREKSGARGKGPTAVITDIGILTPDPVTQGTDADRAASRRAPSSRRSEATGWDLKVAPQLERTAGADRRRTRGAARPARAHRRGAWDRGGRRVTIRGIASKEPA